MCSILYRKYPNTTFCDSYKWLYRPRWRPHNSTAPEGPTNNLPNRAPPRGHQWGGPNEARRVSGGRGLEWRACQAGTSYETQRRGGAVAPAPGPLLSGTRSVCPGLRSVVDLICPGGTGRRHVVFPRDGLIEAELLAGAWACGRRWVRGPGFSLGIEVGGPRDTPVPLVERGHRGETPSHWRRRCGVGSPLWTVGDSGSPAEL
ncbi:hypothetical protein NDU88_009512 [Pleurodeles waltl]|uniref:Uncharacterized protein n=1 Tax=Pleurodeles waltl TaxID=8319 RepID=A0AAV7QVC3_PLEWA|nr:hypothetical protein NDU88_009512 [Pleurodeles waltl]